MARNYTQMFSRLNRTFGEIHLADITQDHWASYLAEISNLGPVARTHHIAAINCLWRWCVGRGLCVHSDFGPDWRRPTAAEVRRSKRVRQFTAEDVAALLRAADIQMRCLILLGLNCGFGPTDCANAVGFAGNWLAQSRVKTGVERRCPLWPETVAAVAALKREVGEPLFLLARGGRMGARGNEGVSESFTAVCKAAGVKALGFYTLRRTFRTLADELGDPLAAAKVMGHEVGNVAAIYVQHVSDSRLEKLVEHVRQRLAISSAGSV